MQVSSSSPTVVRSNGKHFREVAKMIMESIVIIFLWKNVNYGVKSSFLFTHEKIIYGILKKEYKSKFLTILKGLVAIATGKEGSFRRGNFSF